MKKLLLALPLLGILASCEKSDPWPTKKALAGHGFDKNVGDVISPMWYQIEFRTNTIASINVLQLTSTGDTMSNGPLRWFYYRNFVDSDLIIFQPYDIPEGFSQWTFKLSGNKLIQLTGDVYGPGDTFIQYK